MAYITPPLRATGDVLTAANWNQDVRANFQAFESHGHDGTSGGGAATLGPLTYEDFTDAAAPAAPGAGKTRVYSISGKPRFRAGAAGADTAIVAGGSSWRVFYTDSSGDGQMLAIGADDRLLVSRGTSTTPAFDDAASRRWAPHLMLMGIRG